MNDASVAGRIGGLDLARGLAVVGMFGAHLDIGVELTRDPSSWAAVVNGRSSILFATLAGVSIALLSGGARPVDGIDLVRARLRIAVRAAWIFAIGAVLEWLDTFVAIILGVYAVLFVLALPFLRWSPRRLLVAAGVVAVAGPPLNTLLGQVLSVADAESHYVAELLVTGTYPAMLWLAFVLVGLAVGRLDLGAAGRGRLAGAGASAAVLGYAGGWVSTRALADGVPSAGPEEGFASPVGEWDAAWLSGAEPHSGTTFELVGSCGFAVLVIAGCLMAADRLPLLTAPLQAVGALALSVYTAQIVVLWALLRSEPVTRPQGVGLWLAFVVSAMAVAGLWRWRLGRGPLERLLTWSSTGAAAVEVTRHHP